MKPRLLSILGAALAAAAVVLLFRLGGMSAGNSELKEIHALGAEVAALRTELAQAQSALAQARTRDSVGATVAEAPAGNDREARAASSRDCTSHGDRRRQIARRIHGLPLAEERARRFELGEIGATIGAAENVRIQLRLGSGRELAVEEGDQIELPLGARSGFVHGLMSSWPIGPRPRIRRRLFRP